MRALLLAVTLVLGCEWAGTPLGVYPVPRTDYYHVPCDTQGAVPVRHLGGDGGWVYDGYCRCRDCSLECDLDFGSQESCERCSAQSRACISHW